MSLYHPLTRDEDVRLRKVVVGGASSGRLASTSERPVKAKEASRRVTPAAMIAVDEARAGMCREKRSIC